MNKFLALLIALFSVSSYLVCSEVLPLSAYAMQETRVMPQALDILLADRDNPKKAFIRAAMEGNLEKLKQEFANKENIDETHEGIFGWTDYAVRENLTALQWAIDRSSKAGWGIYGHYFCDDRSKWQSNLLGIIKFLLENKANTNKMTKECYKASDFRYTCHPLAMAYREKLWNVFTLLLDFGAMLPLSDLRWIDPCNDHTSYEYLLNLYRTGSEWPTYGKIDYKSIPRFQR